jgi:hypothetical protein
MQESADKQALFSCLYPLVVDDFDHDLTSQMGLKIGVKQ